jgi:hypothetical protein
MEFLAESVGLLDLTSTHNASVVTHVRDCESQTPKDRHDFVLSKHVEEKVCSNGDFFTGHVDALTGELIHGRRIYRDRQEAYEGPFLNGKRHGAGAVCTKLDGSGKYIGTFRKDVFIEGTYITSDYTYSGQFQDGRFCKYGTLMQSSGTIYQGEWKNGIYHGQGKLIHTNNDVYEGQFFVGQKEGQGTMKYSNGSIYEGKWRSDVKHGPGKEIYGCASLSYEGEFLYDQRHGRGTKFSPNVELTGPWSNGVSVDSTDWTIVYPKKSIVYVGAAQGCRPHGKGKLRLQQGKCEIVYEGEFTCGLRHGNGKITLPCAVDHAYETVWKGDLPCRKLDSVNAVKTANAEFDKAPDKLLPLLDSAPLSARGSDSSIIPTMISLDNSSGSASASDDSGTGGDNSPEDEFKIYNNGDTFQGQLDPFGKRCGFGIYTQKLTGAVYSGKFLDSRRHGKGTFTSPLSGVQYVGDFVDDVMQGKGSINLPDGSTYKGEFYGGIIHGCGVFEDATNESRYEGEFYKGLKDGKGKEIYPDGTFYSGSFVMGRRCGSGSLYHQRRGEPELLYEGDWVDNAITGTGHQYMIEFPSLGSYEGEFKDGRRHGHGTFTVEDGFVIEGRWIQDRPLDGDWSVTYPDGSTYFGAATCDNEMGIPIANGFGTHNDANGDFFSGSFVDGKRHGSGLCVYVSGERWDGKWQDGKFTKYCRSRP